MGKLSKIKYLVLAGLIWPSILPSQVIALQDQSSQNVKPALLALAEVKSLIRLFDLDQTEEDPCQSIFVSGSALIGQTNPSLNLARDCRYSNTETSHKLRTIKRQVIVTAYSSTPDQTDSSPFITAMGSYVRDGIVACNFLKFGTKVRFPEVYGNKVFVVEDRMAKRNSHKVDIWMPDRAEALQFGVKRLTLEILE